MIITDNKKCDFSNRHNLRGGVEHLYQGGRAIQYYETNGFERGQEALKNAALIEFPDTGILEISGADSERLLHLLLSQDIARMPVGGTAWSSSVNRQGRILSDMRIWRMEQGRFLALIPPGNSEEILKHIQFHIVTEDVVINDLGLSTTRFILKGLRIATVLGELRHDSHIATHSFSGFDAHTAQGPELGIPCRDILVPAEFAGQFMDEMETRGVRLVGTKTYDALRIEKGIPHWGVDANTSCIPNEAGFTESIGFGKGCFLGHEVITRVFQMGVRSKLMGISFLPDVEPPSVGAHIVSKEGLSTQMTSVSWCPNLNRYAGLILVPTEFATLGSELWAESCEGPKIGTITALPFSVDA